MNTYTVYLYRSGRVFVMVGEHPNVPHDIEQPILCEVVEANTEIAALGKLLLRYLDAASQPYQSIPICIESCCRMCKCGEVYSKHTPANTRIYHAFDPTDQEPS